MAYDLEEQESIEQLKAWWEKWGTPVTAAVCVVCVGFAGWNGWQWWKRNQAAKAAAVYMSLENAVYNRDVKNVASLSNGLIESYGSTIYGPLAAFSAAQVSLAEGNTADAAAKLKWVIEKSGRPEYDTIARVRLAGVYYDEGRFDEALAALAAAKPAEGQKTVVLDRQGDIHRARGDVAKARECWAEVLRTAAQDDPIVRVVEYKLGALPSA